jgi:hypothetical protein
MLSAPLADRLVLEMSDAVAAAIYGGEAGMDPWHEY